MELRLFEDVHEILDREKEERDPEKIKGKERGRKGRSRDAFAGRKKLLLISTGKPGRKKKE